MGLLELLLETGFWVATVRMATPLLFGTLGELLCERAGVLNLGIEGIMAAGCMGGWCWVYLGGSLWGAVAFAAAVGAALGLLHALLTVRLGLSQHVTGLGITMLPRPCRPSPSACCCPRPPPRPRSCPSRPWTSPG